MKLVSFDFDCGRSGSLPGLVAVDGRGEALLNALVSSGTDVYFGEVLGKHSDVCGPIETRDFSILGVSCKLVCALVDELGYDAEPWYTISGYNPLAYYYERNAKSEWDGHKYIDEPINDAIKRLIDEMGAPG